MGRGVGEGYLLCPVLKWALWGLRTVVSHRHAFQCEREGVALLLEHPLQGLASQMPAI